MDKNELTFNLQLYLISEFCLNPVQCKVWRDNYVDLWSLLSLSVNKRRRPVQTWHVTTPGPAPGLKSVFSLIAMIKMRSWRAQSFGQDVGRSCNAFIFSLKSWVEVISLYFNVLMRPCIGLWRLASGHRATDWLMLLLSHVAALSLLSPGRSTQRGR